MFWFVLHRLVSFLNKSGSSTSIRHFAVGPERSDRQRCAQRFACRRLCLLLSGAEEANVTREKVEFLFSLSLSFCSIKFKKIYFFLLRLVRKFLPTPNNRITKWAMPKRNITTCLDCGSYHEMGTICGKCYETVKRSVKAAKRTEQKKQLEA